MSIEFAAEFRGEFLGGEMLTCGAPIGLSMVCGEPRVVGDDNLLNPVVIFEVLSPSTEKYHGGVKLQNFKTTELSILSSITFWSIRIRSSHIMRPDRLYLPRDKSPRF